jgi:hypothetical protein
VIAGSEWTLVLRTNKSSREVAAALREALGGVVAGSMDHLLIGPPRATVWAYLFDDHRGNVILTASLITKDNADHDYVAQQIERPLKEIASRKLNCNADVLSGSNSMGRSLASELANAQPVPVGELGLS